MKTFYAIIFVTAVIRKLLIVDMFLKSISPAITVVCFIIHGFIIVKSARELHYSAKFLDDFRVCLIGEIIRRYGVPLILCFVILFSTGGEGGPSLWTFDYPIGGDPSNWSSKRDSWGGGLVEQIPSRPNSRPLVMNGDMEGEFELSKDETLPDLLERLSLSDHLNLFQVRLLKQTGTKKF